MLIHVRHVTRYRYAEPAKYSVQRLRLTPPSFDGQKRALLAYQGAGHRDRARLSRRVRQLDASGQPDGPARGGHGHRRQAWSRPRIAPGSCATSRRRCRRPCSCARRPPPGRAAASPELAAEVGALRRPRAAARADERGARRASTTGSARPTPTPPPPRRWRRAGRVPGPCPCLHRRRASLGVPARYVSGYMVRRSRAATTRRPPRLGRGLGARARLGRVRSRQRHLPDRPVRRLAAGLDARSRGPGHGARRGGAGEALAVDARRDGSAVTAPGQARDRDDLLRRHASSTAGSCSPPTPAPTPASTTSPRSASCMSGNARATGCWCCSPPATSPSPRRW